MSEACTSELRSIMKRFIEGMGLIAKSTPKMVGYDGGLNVYVDTGESLSLIVAQVVADFPNVHVYGMIYDDGGTCFPHRGTFDIYDPGSFRELRECLLERVKIQGYTIEADV